jgi:hypothetical protein
VSDDEGYLDPLRRGEINRETFNEAYLNCDRTEVREALKLGYKALSESETNPARKRDFEDKYNLLESGVKIRLFRKTI